MQTFAMARTVGITRFKALVVLEMADNRRDRFTIADFCFFLIAEIIAASVVHDIDNKFHNKEDAGEVDDARIKV
jgi:hypothetical protein